jgi:hypothetical protein
VLFLLLCISKLPGVERLALFLLGSQNFVMYHPTLITGAFRTHCSQNFVMYHPTLITGDLLCFFFCYVLADCLEWSDSRFTYSQQPRFLKYHPTLITGDLSCFFFCYVLANCLEWSDSLFSYSGAQILLCIIQR